MDKSKLYKLLNADFKPHVELFNKLNSTNQYCLDQKIINETIVVADEQTAGRGQRGHSFYSPKHTGIYFSIVLPVSSRFLMNPGILTIGIGIAVSKAIYQISGIQVGLKWINDIYFKHHKCAGILVETNVNEKNHIQSFVIGVGINLYPNDFPSKISHRAGFLFSKNNFSNEKIIAEIYNNIVNMYFNQSQDYILDSYRNMLIWVGKKVQINIENIGLVKGTLQGIDEMARLLLKADSGKLYHCNYSDSSNLRLIE
ncbi:biotin--[acetyl-CoA-carboxylase] ligase [Apilactobacillus xinyiensis]|uniref:biotin--[acetyl-CoA-carboxylase] ligase n=1 Tax=Apilactobacillus xinyiensis TaxID=2841032 RepID=UPI00200D4B40|nr:biotin--[acetyl-CoA-carboxylase] ligase [Apilactobacillus xinyiensis]